MGILPTPPDHEEFQTLGFQESHAPVVLYRYVSCRDWWRAIHDFTDSTVQGDIILTVVTTLLQELFDPIVFHVALLVTCSIMFWLLSRLPYTDILCDCGWGAVPGQHLSMSVQTDRI